jgi:hypothetical protein
MLDRYHCLEKHTASTSREGNIRFNFLESVGTSLPNYTLPQSRKYGFSPDQFYDF